MTMSTASNERIAIVLPDLRGGGAERVCVNLANEVVRRGFDVDVVLMRLQGELVNQIDPRVRVVDLRAPRVRNFLLPLIRYLRSNPCNALVVNMWPLTVITGIAHRLARHTGKVVLVEHTNWTASQIAGKSLRRRLVGLSMRWFFPWADERVAVSEGSARSLVEISGLSRSWFNVLYNPVVGRPLMEADAPVSLEAWWQGEHKRVIAIGTLRKDKDFESLLHAFKNVCASTDAKLLILGEGGLRASLEELVDRLGLRSKVFMPGFVSEPRIYLQRADLFVLSSRAEGLPTVVIEAIEQGTPVVSTDCPSGPREILEDGKFGTLVPVGDVEALAKAMEDALAREHDHEALKRRAQDFSVDKAADAYLDLLLPDWREQPA